MNTEELIEGIRLFLIEANQHGYGANQKNGVYSLSNGARLEIIDEPDGSKSIIYEHGDWRYHDNWFGGEPYGGRSVVFYQGKPVWMMVYYGAVYPGADREKIYAFLRKALLQAPANFPVRGPGDFFSDPAPGNVTGDLMYDFLSARQGSSADLGDWDDLETIRELGKTVYRARIVGGLVNQR